MIETFIKFFTFYFVVIDPIGSSTVFLMITEKFKQRDKVKIALSASITAAVVLLFFAILGKNLLSYLGISIAAFTVAGGIILFLISLEMLFDKRRVRREENINFKSENISVFPLGIPLLAGPGAITSVVITANDIGSDIAKQLSDIFAIILVMIMTFIIWYFSLRFKKYINKKALSVFSRVIGIILAGLSIQYIVNGVKHILG
jgi:multiple antibiotic resistance protein